MGLLPFRRSACGSGRVAFVIAGFVSLVVQGLVLLPPADAGVVFSEIMYHPVDATNGVAGDQFEFLELFNPGGTPVTLTGSSFTKGITYTFSTATTLNPGTYLVVVKDRASFQSRYPGVTNLAEGAFTGQLANTGEQVTLKGSGGSTLFSVTYGTSGAWPRWPDGLGGALVLRDAGGNPDVATNWFVNARYNGNPGGTDTCALADVAVNEVLTHTDPPQEDAVELFNTTTNAINLTGWVLSDDPARPDKYHITAGVIPAHGFKVFYEYQINDTNSLLASNNVPFSFSSHGGDEVILCQPGVSNTLRLADVVSFGAADNGVSFGRSPDGTGTLVTLDALTLGTTNAPTLGVFRTGAGASNSPPRVGPVVISEIMYAPASGLAEDEYIEVLNITTNAVPLYNLSAPTNTWALMNAVSFYFPTNVTLPAGQRLLISGATNITVFRATYSLSTNVPVYGPWTGKLDNAGESVELYKPDDPEPGLTPYILVDRVEYLPADPWPTGAGGYGPSLERSVNTNPGNNAENWFDGAPGGSPGTASAGGFVNPLVSPSSPLSGQAFTVTVAVVERSIPTQIVMRTVISGVTNNQVMHDDGAGGDGVAADRTYTTIVSGQADGTWVYYSFIASLSNAPPFVLPVGSWFSALVGVPPPDVVISEIMYHPVQSNEAAYEYVELYNTSGSAIDLGGWTLSGLSFILPAGTVVGANAYIVCCGNAATIAAFYGITNIVGNWAGSLDNGGETLALVNAYGRTVDSVRYDDREPWPCAADGYGPSLERYTMTAPAATSVNWTASMAATNWQQVVWTGQINSANAPIAFCLDFDGKCYLDDVSVKVAGTTNELVSNGSFESGLAGWSATNTHSQSRLEAGMGRAGGTALAIQCNEGRWILDAAPYSVTFYGDAASNGVFSAPLGTVAGTNHVVSWWVRRSGIGGTVSSIIANATNAQSLASFGTPGGSNSVAAGILPIGITDVSRAYILCPVGTANVIRAQLSTTSGVSSVRVYFKVVGTNQYDFTNGSYSNALMRDDGVAPDTLAGDGNYAVTMPVVTSAWKLVRYHVGATATNGFQAVSPHLDDPGGDDAYWVQGVSPQTTLPNWQLLVDGDPILYPVSRHVCAVSPDGQIFTDITARHRGNPDTSSPQRTGLALAFHRSRPYDAWFAAGQDSINIRHRGNTSAYLYRRIVAEPLAYDLQRTVGFPTPRWRFVCCWIEGVPTITTELEDPGDAFLDGNGLSHSDYLSRQSYGHGRSLVAGDPALDNFSAMETALYSLTSANRNESIRTNLCYESVQHCLALLSVTGDGDQTLDWNMFQHRGAADGRWRQYPWDTDICFDITFSKSWTALTNLHPYYRTPAHPSIWSTNSVSSLGLPLFYPETNDVTTLPYRYRQQMTLWRYYHTLYTTNYLFPRLESIQSLLAPAFTQIDAFSSSGITLPALSNETASIRNFIVSRRDYYMNGNWSDKMTNIWTASNLYNPSNIVVTEIMHTPLTGGKYIELYNRGTQAVDLSHWLLTSGDFSCYLPFGTMMASNSFLVLTEAEPALTTAYVELEFPVPLIERYSGTGLWDWPIVFTSATEYASRVLEIPGLKVPDGGATLELRDMLSNRIEAVTYSNTPPWPAASGVALERIDPAVTATGAAAWRASTITGTPGTLNSATADTDLDGVPDALEQQIIAASGGVFTNLSQVLPGADFDGDGIANSNEFILGTDPVISDKDRAALGILTTGGTVRVTFQAIPATGATYTAYSGRYYTLQGTPGLAEGLWTAEPNCSNMSFSGWFDYTNPAVLNFKAFKFQVELRPIR